MERKFNCTKCGLCCKTVSKELLDQFGLPLAASGGCGHLTADNTCEIYDTRPEICRVDKMYERFKHLITWEQMTALNEEACKRLQEANVKVQQLQTNKST